MAENQALVMDDNAAVIDATDWEDMVNTAPAPTFDSMVKDIAEAVAHGGHFAILGDDGSVQRRIDRMADLVLFVDEAKARRLKLSSEGTVGGT